VFLSSSLEGEEKENRIKKKERGKRGNPFPPLPRKRGAIKRGGGEKNYLILSFPARKKRGGEQEGKEEESILFFRKKSRKKKKGGRKRGLFLILIDWNAPKKKKGES